LAAGAAAKLAAQTASAQEAVPKESWAFVGYAEPESAFQSMVWAMSHGDVKTFLASMSPDAPDLKDSQGKSEDEIAAKIKEFGGVTAFKIIDNQSVSPDEAILTDYAFGVNESARFRFQRFGSDWKFAGKGIHTAAAK
jgi:hypothetical protein